MLSFVWKFTSLLDVSVCISVCCPCDEAVTLPHALWHSLKCSLTCNPLWDLTLLSVPVSAVHTSQRMDGCEWDDETGEVNGFGQFGLDGEDFIAFDPKTLTWIAQKPEANDIKHIWDSDRLRNEVWKNILTQIFPKFLKRYLDLGKSYLLRTGRITWPDVVSWPNI